MAITQNQLCQGFQPLCNAEISIGAYISRFKLAKPLQTTGTWSKVSANIGILLSKFKQKNKHNFQNLENSLKNKRNH